MPTFQFFQLEIQDAVARLTLNRPEKANAFHELMWEEIRDAFIHLEEVKGLRVVLLAGAGKHFCAGIDLSLLESLSAGLGSDTGRASEALSRRIAHFQECFSAVERCRVPVIAVIQGACLGAGLDLISACDLRFCSEDAQFAIREMDMGMVADVGSLQRLPKIIGDGPLRELAYTGRSLSGREAERIALVNRCFSDFEDLNREVERIAREIARKSPLAIRNTKQMLLYARDHSVAESLRYVSQLNGAMLQSEDLRKSVQAFLEKKPATYLD